MAINAAHSRVIARQISPAVSLCSDCRLELLFKHAQIRNASTTRRHKKLLNVAPAPSFGGPAVITGGSGRSRKLPSLPEQDYIVFNPPPSSPNVYHTPLKFLPSDDPRRALLTRRSPVRLSTSSNGSMHSNSIPKSLASDSYSDPSSMSPDAVYYTSTPTSLPPPVRRPYKKAYHLNEADIADIRRLRKEDEEYWTRERLAEKFKCSNLFVGLVVQASEGRLQALRAQENEAKSRWGIKRTLAREDRGRRKELWQRDE